MGAQLARLRAGAVPTTPAAKAYAEALKATKRGRYAVAPIADRTVDGIVFASKGEAGHYLILKLRERLGEIRALRLQPTWRIEIDGKLLCRYTADFEYLEVATGRVIIAEWKTSGTAKERDYRLRRRAFEITHCAQVLEVRA